MKTLSTLAVLFVAVAAALLPGCKKDETSTTTPVDTEKYWELSTYRPKGTIHGVIRDACTNDAIAGAVLSVGFDGVVQTVTSDAAGQFTFANVPAGRFTVV